jgi:hypothetical protein
VPPARLALPRPPSWAHPPPAAATPRAGLAAARERGNRIGIVRALSGLGLVAARAGDHRAPRPLLEQSLAIRDEVGDRQGTWLVMRWLVETCRDLGDYAAARAWLDRGLAVIHERHGRGPSGKSTTNPRLQADVARLAGDGAHAAARYAAALRMYAGVGDVAGVAGCLAGLAAVAAPARPQRAARRRSRGRGGGPPRPATSPPRRAR